MMNYIKCILVSIAFALTYSVKAGNPNWKVDKSNFQFSMNYTVAVQVNQNLLSSENVYVGAFVEDECRGVVKFKYDADYDIHIGYLWIYANKPNEAITFKVYDGDKDEIVVPKNKVDFTINDRVGSTQSPYILSKETLNSEAKFLSFEFLDVDSNTEITEEEIVVSVKGDVNVTNLVPKFTTSTNTKVYVNGIAQKSEESTQDFTDSVMYKLVSEDGSRIKNIKVMIKLSSTNGGNPNNPSNPSNPSNATTKYVYQYSNSTLIFDNSSLKFIAWQWYKDDVIIANATKQYYTNENLEGAYYVIATTQDGKKVKSNTYLVTGNIVDYNFLKLTPNPVSPEQEYSLSVNTNQELLEKASLIIYDLRGKVLLKTTEVSQNNKLVAPNSSGIYIIRLLFPKGVNRSINLLVK